MKSSPLKTERKRREWSQAEVAEALGVTIQTVSRWERGQTIPHPYYRSKLSTLFSKTAEELGLLPDTDENDGVQEVLSSTNPFEGRFFREAVSQGTGDTEKVIWHLAAFQTDSLDDAPKKPTHESSVNPPPAPEILQQKSLQVNPMKRIAIFWPFSPFSWRSVLMVAMILLTVLVIIAVPLIKRGEKQASSPSTSVKGEDLASPPSYTLVLQNADPSLVNTVQYLQQAFHAVYPQLVNRFALDPHSAKFRTVKLTFAPPGASLASIDGVMISINADWIRQHPSDIGLLTHELTLLVEQYPHGAPGWFVDGMADYARSVYGPADDEDWSLPNGVGAQDSYRQGGAVSARFLLWLEQHSRLDLVDQLNHALQTGESFSDAFERLTQHTVDELWSQYQAQPDIIQTPEQLYKTVTSRKPLYYSSLLHVRITQWHTFKPIFAPGLSMSNFAIQADMTVFSGNGEAGFVFRNQNAVSYYLRVRLDGRYEIINQTNLLASGISSVIRRGLYQRNRLTIVAQKHTIYLYINGQFMTKVDDSSSSYGEVGVMAIDETKATKVSFENLQIF